MRESQTHPSRCWRSRSTPQSFYFVIFAPSWFASFSIVEA